MVKVENMDKTESEKRPTKKRIKECISVVRKLNEVFSNNETKKSLLDDSSESIVFLQVTLKKIPPKKMKRMVKVRLPHSLMTDTTEVCLITGDLEKNNKKAEIEPTVLHYKEHLKKQGVKGISEVVPLRQLRTEYKTFESKRQLAAAYDMFINDKKITGCLPRVLGKAFYEKRKFPISINLDSPNLKDQVEKAVSEIVFNLSCRGNSCASEVARLSMEDSEILENIQSCIEILAEKIPGKWTNVLGLYIKTAKSEALPIYMSFENPNELKVKAPRHQEKVKAEELSTFRNAEVKVFKDGRLIVKNLSGSEDESDEEDLANEGDVKPKTRKLKTKVLANDASDNEVNAEDSNNKADVKSKNKRKKTKIQDSVDEAVVQTSDNEEDAANEALVKPKIKKMKTEALANDATDNEVEVEDSINEADVKPKNKTKKTKKLVKNVTDNEDVSTNKEDIKPEIKRRKTKALVRNASNNENEGKEIDSANEAGIKPKNKRKKTNELVGNASNNKPKEKSCVNEVDVLPKIKRRKTKDSNNEVDVKVIETKKRKTNVRNKK